MSKHMFVISDRATSFRRRLVLLAGGVGLVVWFIQSPAEAADGVKAGWSWFTGVVDGAGTFITSLG